MTKRFVLPVFAIGLLAWPALASDLRSARAAKPFTYIQFERQTGVQEDEILIPPPQPMPPRRPLHLRLVEFVECPVKPLVEYLQSPNSELRRLLDESENLRKVRDAFRQVRVSSTIRPF
jgi:hypothetical protein